MNIEKFYFQNFDGNTDDNTIKYNGLKEPFVAQYVRFNPRQWNNFIALRVELYGCNYGKSNGSKCQ